MVLKQKEQAIVQGKPIDNPETIATAIRIGNPASWGLAEAARDESGGYIHSVTDDEIVNAYKKLQHKMVSLSSRVLPLH